MGVGKLPIPYYDRDGYIIANYSKVTLKAMAAHLGWKWQGVQQRVNRLIKQGRLKREDRFWHPNWTEDEDEYLNDNWGVLADKVVSRKLKRSVDACKIRVTRYLGINRHSNHWSARDVGRLFGVDAKTVLHWMQRGWIKGRRAPVGANSKNNQLWSINYDSLEFFVTDMGWAYDYRRMVKGEYLTTLAEDSHKKDPWLSLDEACKALSWQRARLSRWIQRGVVPHKRRPKQKQAGPHQGLIVIRRSDLASALAEITAAVHRNRSESARRRRSRGAAVGAQHYKL